MTDILPRVILPWGLVLGGLSAFYWVLAGSASGNAYLFLGGLIGFEILLLAVWNYSERFLPILLVTFLGAGLMTPLHQVFTVGRWGVLAVGAVAGFVFYMRAPVQKFGGFHLLAAFAVMTASVSALVSDYPKIAFLKALSLMLVFLYGAAGARCAVVGREAKFFAGLLLGCEILVYASAFSYFVLRWALYGNPNSLGVVMGVAAYPILLWGVICTEGTRSYRRRVFALVLCLLLVVSSYSRASMGAAALSSLFLCLALRRYRLLAKGTALALIGAILIMIISPIKGAEAGGTLMDRLSDSFLYKGKREQGFFGSRDSPWQQTSAVIREHPWFGSGFGTSVTSLESRPQDLAFQSVQGATREHGTSYLAIVEWTGLLGVVPFYALVLLILVNVIRVFLWLRRTGNPFSPAVPIAAMLAGAMFHAAFEDWMFAVGYYMCVFFWVLAFVWMDVLPTAAPEVLPSASRARDSAPSWPHSSQDVIVSGLR